MNIWEKRKQREIERVGAENYSKLSRRAGIGFGAGFLLGIIADASSDSPSGDPIEVILKALFLGSIAAGVTWWISEVRLRREQ
jgi:hypothetical protein